MLGEATADELAHAAQCPGCASEVARLQTAVAGFSAAATAAAGRLAPLPPRVPAETRAARSWALRWSLAAALALLTAAPIFYAAHHRQLQLERERALRADQADAAFIAQVDAEVSRPVPAAMQPLVQLVSSPTASPQGGSTK